MFRKTVVSAVLASAAWLMGATAANCETQSADPLATFKALNSYLTANPLDFETTFSSRSAIIDTELINGKSHFMMVRPNLLRLDTTSSKGSFLVVSDGKTLTILDKGSNKYARTPAPATVGAAVNVFTGLMAIQPQILMFLDAVQTAADGVTKVDAAGGGAETIAGRTCNKFSVVGTAGANWDAWLDGSGVPLPCKLVSRDSDNPDAAVQTNTFKWNEKAAPANDTFTFTPPKDSKLVNFGDLGMTE